MSSPIQRESQPDQPRDQQDAIMDDNDTMKFLGLATSPPTAQLAHLRRQSLNLLQTNQAKALPKAPVSASLSFKNIWSTSNFGQPSANMDDLEEEEYTTTWENWNKR